MKRNKIITGILLIFFAGCTSLGRHNTFEINNRINSIEKIISHAESAYSSDKLDKTRKLCDKALHKLFNKKSEIGENEYERLHTEIALLRVKTNRSSHPMVSAVKCELFPLVWNSRVDKWINYYTGRGRADFLRCVKRSKKYIKYVKKILIEHGLPQDLVYVPIVESGYYPFARSKAGAVGLWQFMKKTAKLNGLKIDFWIDERRDTDKATAAAARVLKDLYREFGTWEIALAAYNYGAYGVRRRIKKWGTDDYWELYLPRETENFVPKIMATMFILREPDLFGFKSFYNNGDEYRWKNFEVTNSVDLRDVAKYSGVDMKEIQVLNPELMQMCTPPGKTYNIRIPEESYERFASKFKALNESEKYLSKKEIDRRIRKVVYYRVRRGDSIWKISKKFRVSMHKIKKWNNLRTDLIRPRQKLKIYRYGS